MPSPKLVGRRHPMLRYIAKRDPRKRAKGNVEEAVEWYLKCIRGLVPNSEQYENELHELVEHGEVGTFVEMYLEHRNDTKWIERQRQQEQADLGACERHDDMVTFDMATQRFKESGGR